MENKYHRGKIYKIVSNHTDKVYIGSTVQSLAKRIGGHRSNYKQYLKGNHRKVMSFDIVCFDDAKIYLIEEFKCESKNELERKERFYIESIECCNKVIPCRTSKEYNVDNKEKIKEYYQKNKDELKEYYQKNKEKISIREKEKVECEICKSIVSKKTLKRHQKSIKCKSYICIFDEE